MQNRDALLQTSSIRRIYHTLPLTHQLKRHPFSQPVAQKKRMTLKSLISHAVLFATAVTSTASQNPALHQEMSAGTSNPQAPEKRTAPMQPFQSRQPQVMSYFTRNGEDGLHLAISPDGLHWTPVAGARSLFQAGVAGENLMRDPFLLPAHDGSGYHCLWTTGWSGRSIGYAFSTDLVSWTEARALPVMESIEDAGNAWAPEAVYDTEQGDYLIYFASRIPSRYEGHRMHHVRTKDFNTISDPELFYDPGHSVIDTHLIHDPERHRWLMITKNEEDGNKCLFTATGPAPSGPWSDPSAPIAGKLTEGATSIRGDQGWLLLYDAYGAHQYQALTSQDLQTFEDASSEIHFEGFPERVRHGTALSIDDATYQRLAALQ